MHFCVKGLIMTKTKTHMAKELLGLTPVSLKSTRRSDLKRYFEKTWALYEMLFASIRKKEHYYLAPDPLRNPLIFYYGHTAAFYVNKLVLCGILEKGINLRFEKLFATGVDPELPDDLEIETVWPDLEEVKAYRQVVYALVSETIDRVDIPEQLTSKDPLWNLHMAIEHDLIHFETSSVLIRQMDVEHLIRPAAWEYAQSFGFSKEFELIPVQAGSVTLGQEEPSELYGWDNEFGHLEVEVQDFAASKNLVTNGEFIHFVKSGGYENPVFWTEEAQEWKSRTHTILPKFWLHEGDIYRYRAMFDIIDMPLDWPAEVNAHEAKAYCKFKGDEYRLLTEAEFKLLASRSHPNEEPALSSKFNLKMQFGSPTPVGYREAGAGEIFNDLYGNVWEWLSDNFYPLPGFCVHDHYADFSEPYFDDDHSMLLGGSWATNGAGASQYYRLWFRDNFYQHAGFRLAMDRNA